MATACDVLADVNMEGFVMLAEVGARERFPAPVLLRVVDVPAEFDAVQQLGRPDAVQQPGRVAVARVAMHVRVRGRSSPWS